MELVIIFALLILAALGSFFAKRRTEIELISVIAPAVALISSVAIALKVAAFGSYAPLSFSRVDALGAILMLIVALVGLAAAAYSVFYLREETAKQIIGFRRVRQYFASLNLFFGAMFLAVASNNPILTWISIEATTLATAFLISFYNKPSAMEAAWKYLIINSIGLLLGFFGTLLYLTSLLAAGEPGFATWQSLLMNAAYLNPLIAKIAFIFVLIGYGTKAGLAPMHTWLPDAHSKAPVPISALLSGVLLNVAFVAMLRFKVVTDAAVGRDFSQKLLIVFGLLSILIASLIIFTQKNYKRLLAYSSIENMGIAALGFGFGGLGAFAAVFHIIYHSLLKSALFLSAGTIFIKYSSTKIANVRGAIKALPVTSLLFLAGFFAITGAPPFGVFFTKIFVLAAGAQAHPIVAVVALFSTALLFVGFLKHIAGMVFGEPPEGIKIGEGSVWLIIPPLALIVAALFLSFYTPPFISILITAASAY